MTREEAKQLLPIIQAYAEGKTIECKGKSLFGSWTEANSPSWSDNLEYRIKPELNENRNEMIKTAILNHLKIMWGNCQDDVCGVHVEDAIDWVEKQGNNSTDSI